MTGGDSFRDLEQRVDALEPNDGALAPIGILEIHKWLDHVEAHRADADPPHTWASPGTYVPTAQEAIDDLLNTDWEWREEYPVLGKHFSGLTYPELFALRYRQDEALKAVIDRRAVIDEIDVEAFNADLRAEFGEEDS